MAVRHRGTTFTEESYNGIPAHAGRGVHGKVADILIGGLPKGARVLDLGAGQGALAQRLHDVGFDVVAADLSLSDWMAKDIYCNICDLDGDWGELAAIGPFDAVVVSEVIEHLENPREFLRKVISLAEEKPLLLVITTPNPIDTFSAITVFTRGVFNWFSPAHYFGGGHISILPYWLIDLHLEYLGQPRCQWLFCSPFDHPKAIRRILYALISKTRRHLMKGAITRDLEGQTAIGYVRLKVCAKEARN